MNAFGIQQVSKAADKLSEMNWDFVLTSPLGRARQTAEILANKLGVSEVITQELLLERAFGVGEGMLYDEWSNKYAHLDEIPGAESTAEITARAERVLAHLEQEFEGKKVLAVSHGALIRFVLQVVTNGEIPPKGERLENASLNIVKKIDKWVLEQWAPKPLGN